MRIADLLSHGQENAVPLQHLVALTNTDGRTVRAKEIERAAEAVEQAEG